MQANRVHLVGACLAQSAADGSLYQRLGGKAAVNFFVGEAVDKADLRQLKDLLTAQICSRTGGGCDLTADSPGRPISDAQFTGLVESLRHSMRSHDVPIAARNQLLEILAPMRRDLVGP